MEIQRDLMRYLPAIALCTIALIIIACSGCLDGGSRAQTFETNHGQIQINTPETLEPTLAGSVPSIGMLSLGRKNKGSPLIVITLTDNSAFSNFEYAVQTTKMMPLLDERELTTNDNHKMHWSVVNVAGFKQYEGIIDYGDDKDLVVSIKGLSETADMMTGEKVPGFSENEYLDIFKSFKFVESDGQSIKPTETDQDQSIKPTEAINSEADTIHEIDADTASVNASDISTPSESGDASEANTKTSYTKDGINFISEERLEQNIRHGWANLGEYEKVQVPLDTFVAEPSPE
jgi:hypothetical protein